MDLETFIDDLLCKSGAPLSAAVTTLMIISWVTDTGACRLASLSPHHLFLSIYEVIVRAAYEAHDDWEEFVDDIFPPQQAIALRWEVEDALETLSRKQMQFILALIDEDTIIEEEMSDLITEPYMVSIELLCQIPRWVHTPFCSTNASTVRRKPGWNLLDVLQRHTSSAKTFSIATSARRLRV